MDCSPPGYSVHGISQARILERVAISFPGDLPDPGIEPRSPALQADLLPPEPQRRPEECREECRMFLGMTQQCTDFRNSVNDKSRL